MTNMYKKRGIRISQINADNEFECIREEVHPTHLNVVAAGKHVGDIERGNKSLKEGTRCKLHQYPYEYYQQKIIKRCVIKVTKDHNDLPQNDGISDFHGPGTLVTGYQKPDYRC